ncbi:MAG: hypothetical protein U0871_02070 [Gemmataceae bacterium]
MSLGSATPADAVTGRPGRVGGEAEQDACGQCQPLRPRPPGPLVPDADRQVGLAGDDVVHPRFISRTICRSSSTVQTWTSIPRRWAWRSRSSVSQSARTLSASPSSRVTSPTAAATISPVRTPGLARRTSTRASWRKDVTRQSAANPFAATTQATSRASRRSGP